MAWTNRSRPAGHQAASQIIDDDDQQGHGSTAHRQPTFTVDEVARLCELAWSQGLHQHRASPREALERDCTPFGVRVTRLARLLDRAACRAG